MGRSKVAILRTSPATVLRDYHELLNLAGYQDVAPLASGWQQRVALHQLFPLLVHAVLFGGGYGVSAAAAARATLG